MGSSMSNDHKLSTLQSYSSEENFHTEIDFWQALLTAERKGQIPPLGSVESYSLGIHTKARRGHTAIVVIPRRKRQYTKGFTLELCAAGKKSFLKRPDIVEKKTPDNEYAANWIYDTHGSSVIVRKIASIVLVDLAIRMIRGFGEYNKYLDNCRHFVAEMEVRWQDDDLDFFGSSTLWDRSKAYHDNTLNPFFYFKIPFLRAMENESVAARFGLGFLSAAPAVVGVVGETVIEPVVGSTVHASQTHITKRRSTKVKKNDAAKIPKFYMAQISIPEMGGNVPVPVCYYCRGTGRSETKDTYDIFDGNIFDADPNWHCIQCTKVVDILRYCNSPNCVYYLHKYCDECAMTDLPPSER